MTLPSWSTIAGEWRGLLLGNGFSVNICDRFNYHSLFDVAKRMGVLKSEAEVLFHEVGTTNFEEILRIVNYAKLVDDIMKNQQTDALNGLYANIQNALTQALRFSHVEKSEVDLMALNSALRGYDDIFTTNYDLILYWAIMADCKGFSDWIFNSDGFFSQHAPEDRWGRCMVHYLHGALHMFGRNDRRTQKLSTAHGISLLEYLKLYQQGEMPLLVSEGTSDWKLKRIVANDYLTFCYESLRTLRGNLLVLGHSLDMSCDRHLVDAINASALDAVAISLYPKQTEANLAAVMAEIRKHVDKPISFFDSTTHPLGSVPRLPVL